MMMMMQVMMILSWRVTEMKIKKMKKIQPTTTQKKILNVPSVETEASNTGLDDALTESESES